MDNYKLFVEYKRKEENKNKEIENHTNHNNKNEKDKDLKRDKVINKNGVQETEKKKMVKSKTANPCKYHLPM